MEQKRTHYSSTIASALGEPKHTLHLYSSDINKYVIQIPFLLSSEQGKIVYVTNDDPNIVKKAFKKLNIELKIIRPEEFEKTLVSDHYYSRIVVDASSINFDHLQREKYITNSCKNHIILCTYDVSKTPPELIKQLVTLHDKLILTTSNTTFLSGEFLNKAYISQEAIEQLVKNELESIVLALLLKKPLCGVDIIKFIYDHFNILLSPSVVYSLLHQLEERGLLKYEYKVKMKTYKPDESSKEKIYKMLEERIKANMFLNNFLRLIIASITQQDIRTSEDKV